MLPMIQMEAISSSVRMGRIANLAEKAGHVPTMVGICAHSIPIRKEGNTMDQPPDGQPPFTEYPHTHYQRYPPQPAPRKKVDKLWFILIPASLLALCLVGNIIRVLTLQNAAPADTYQGTWTTTHTFSGAGNKETETFFISENEWKLVWSCNPSSDYIGEYNLIVKVYDADDVSMNKLAINEICKSGNIHGETILRRGGNIYVDIVATGQYSLKVQELE